MFVLVVSIFIKYLGEELFRTYGIRNIEKQDPLYCGTNPFIHLFVDRATWKSTLLKPTRNALLLKFKRIVLRHNFEPEYIAKKLSIGCFLNL